MVLLYKYNLFWVVFAKKLIEFWFLDW